VAAGTLASFCARDPNKYPQCKRQVIRAAQIRWRENAADRAQASKFGAGRKISELDGIFEIEQSGKVKKPPTQPRLAIDTSGNLANPIVNLRWWRFS